MSEEKVSFGIVISRELKTRLKMYCAKNDKKIKDAISEALDEYLRKRGF